VTAVLLAYRALDTLIESIVVVFALIGVWSLAPDRVWGGHPGRYTKPILTASLPISGAPAAHRNHRRPLHFFWIGRIFRASSGRHHPGSHVAAGHDVRSCDAPPISRTWLRILLVAGPLLFIAIGFAGALTAGAVLAYPEGYAKLLIKIIEAALMPTLTLTLALLVAGAPERTGRP
jgi:hypothetical protein